MHKHEQRFGVLVLHRQRLDHGERIQPQHLGAVLRAAVLQVFIRVLGERHPVGTQQLRGRGFADMHLLGHCYKNQSAGSRISQRMRSISAKISGDSVVP